MFIIGGELRGLEGVGGVARVKGGGDRGSQGSRWWTGKGGESICTWKFASFDSDVQFKHIP